MKNYTTIKEKSSFWKKLGLGKNKATAITSLNKQQVYINNDDSVSIKSKKKANINSTTSLLSSHKNQSLNKQPIKSNKDEYDTTSTKKQEEVNNDNANDMVTPQHSHDKSSDKTSTLSFVVFEKKDELLETISRLQLELEEERATVDALQKQKEAVTKDLDYLELTVDELSNERTELIQQLEEEKIANQRHLDELNILLDKLKSTADNARDQSFQMSQSKQAFENYRMQAEQEKEDLLDKIDDKDKIIQELKYDLKKAENQTETLKETIDKLIKSHAAEISQLTLERNYYTTPHGSPTLLKSELNEPEDQQTQPITNDMTVTPLSDNSIKDEDLDEQLMKLTKEKEKLQSFYSKIPLSGGGPQSRKRKEELEAKLDQIDSQLSKVKQKIKRS
ncbi:uncharacterized protein BX663DRAFT_507169 [Cokeromyces recurvatus]|uniref:uncharacterized protein n=1 Tax=Cokeromyces recurvatus TaxID=90255 RepID=UPI00221E5DE2|nr:uncharacterized protein BX663DRAFT_507169 [Cokeromyces recurvatus]KAI7903641.1 hypothetical protein BX663DRAFT_507169 [Cokeromyces recurvatus]